MIKTLDAPTRKLYLLLLAGFTVFGVCFTSVGAAVPRLIRTFDWSYTMTGLVLAASAFGYFLSSFLCGLLVRRFPPKSVLLTGLLIGAAGMSLFGRWPSPWLNLCFNLAIGLCLGLMEVVTNLEVIHMEKDGQSRLMNLIHGVLCLGAVAGPAVVGLIMGAGAPLTIIFVGAAVLLAFTALSFAFTPFPRVRPERTLTRDRGLLRQPLLLLLTLALLVYGGAEIGVASWTSEYFVKVLSSTASTGAFALSLFWAGLFAGRMAISFGYRGKRQELLMLGLSCLSSAALAAVLLARSPVAVASAIFLAGLGFSGFYPLATSMVGRYFKSGVAMGTAAMGGAAGSVAFPFLMSLLSQAVGIRYGFFFFLCLNLVLIALSVVVVGLVRRTPYFPELTSIGQIKV